MSTKYVRELLESVDLLNPERAYERIGEALQELSQVEAARDKDAELIQQLVDALAQLVRLEDENNEGILSGSPTAKEWLHAFNVARNEIADAASAGFKPSDR